MKWGVKFVFCAILKKKLINFTINIENVNSVILKDFQNLTRKTEKNIQINDKCMIK